MKLSDGAGLKYSKWLADEWRKNLNFGKSEGWLERFEVLSNVHPRPDEPDLYLIVVFKNMTTPDQDEERRKKYMEWAKKSMEKMYAESADRAEYRTVMGTKLLQEMKFRK
ncbi:hypothetical protein OCL06_13395 [Alteromonas sp. ASW11-19]|uniref:Uncharacterized protein n=1 Tax=Alteromonas salexigens TaxID=2982530 RepID=A0ABT2VUQ0_9ALTE|nr:hypothetical protein [Alteromonas salexigens]MCU7555584.1 hypothetical protein [Alteromonas salexigens]